MNRYLQILGIIFFVTAVSAESKDSTGKVYAAGSNKTKLLYNYVRHEEHNASGQFILKAQFTDLSGTVIFSEELIAQEYRPVKYSYTQNDIQESGSAEVQNGRILYSYTRDGKTRTADDKNSDSFVVGPTIFPFIAAHWPALLGGASLEMRVGVMDRRETITFNMTKIGEFEKEGKPYVRLSMKASNPFIGMLVDPIFFIVEKDTGKTRETEGTNLIRVNRNGHLDNLSANMVFD